MSERTGVATPEALSDDKQSEPSLRPQLLAQFIGGRPGPQGAHRFLMRSPQGRVATPRAFREFPYAMPEQLEGAQGTLFVVE